MLATMIASAPTAEDLQAIFDGSSPSITAKEAHEACRKAKKLLKKHDPEGYESYKAIRWQLKPGKKRGKSCLFSKRAAYVFAFNRLSTLASALGAFAAIGPKATPLYKPCGSATH